MKRSWIPSLISLVLLSVVGLNAPVFAQDVDNEAIAAAKKAALMIEGSGNVPIKPTQFYMTVQFFAEKTGRTATQEEYQRSAETLRNALVKAGYRVGTANSRPLMRRVAETVYQGVTEPESQDQPNAIFRLAGDFGFSVATPEKARAVFAVMRATGVSGDVVLSHTLKDEEGARRAALKVAVAQAKQRVQVLSEAAKPKAFELIFLKEGNFESPSGMTSTRLQGTEPLHVLDTVTANITLTLFYGLKPGTAAAPAKAVATKAPKKPAKKP